MIKIFTYQHGYSRCLCQGWQGNPGSATPCQGKDRPDSSGETVLLWSVLQDLGTESSQIPDQPRKKQILCQHHVPHEQCVRKGPMFSTVLSTFIANTHDGDGAFSQPAAFHRTVSQVCGENCFCHVFDASKVHFPRI